MKLNYILAIAGISLAINAQAQQWENDTINMGLNYSDNVYYSLENGPVKTNPNNQWDLAFRTDLMSVGVYVNHAAAGIKVYQLTGFSAASKFGTNLTADTAGFTYDSLALYNSIQSWDTGALNQDRDLNNIFDLGWGSYNPASHMVEGDKIYLLKTPVMTYQIWVESDDPFNTSNPPEWTFHIADLDGSNVKVKTHNSNPTYSNKLLAYYNLANDTFMDNDPIDSDWDFIFTRYTEKVSQGPVSMMYPVTGVLSNQNRASTELRGMDAVNAAWTPAMAVDMDSIINNIGRDWKMQTQTNGVYDMDTVSYFMKNTQNDIWQFEFIYATSGTATAGTTPGQIVLRKRMVESGTSISNINNSIQQMTVVPNPAQGSAILLIDNKDFVGQSQLSISDISGRVLVKESNQLERGLQKVQLPISNLTAGMYFVTVIADGQKTTCKLIVK